MRFDLIFGGERDCSLGVYPLPVILLLFYSFFSQLLFFFPQPSTLVMPWTETCVSLFSLNHMSLSILTLAGYVCYSCLLQQQYIFAC
ncbi:hypothetical protein BC939DRAFT_453842 [Gamsiella multidivaricata]|uniref:uncharacterized protein n=1 Tax=Gamsiella multidivaricata TaxID=101098 RepID=UPI00221FD12A|nr:uncharacterized protein BC939DRAFT_453842 [Gamsiella multidivaricata]KAI7822335.1 hypothetical protein BC939DRAFT_453842 [Gamsiella multidivaricata]